ncbi:ABC transporter substrate-binding protein [Streptomyces sp. CA-111067]|uniref:ABC transporter substrate-binding protein n=1 Tax=Streptomyces sp. CA-111067 TaxID=3240046 RepID=UPI003D965CB1
MNVMNAMKTLVARLPHCIAALCLLMAAVACGSGQQHGEVTVMVPWSGDEFKAFYAVIKNFQHDTGIRVDVEVTRAQTQQLDAALAAGAPPDLAMLPSVGAINRYVTGPVNSRLRPLDTTITEDYAQPFRGLGSIDGTVYAVPVKADVKSLVWYHPPRKPSVTPATDQTLAGGPEPWCLGLASGATSGWPGADWIADLLLAQGGKDRYEQWLSGDLTWTSGQVAAAWTAWRNLVRDSVHDAPTLEFADAAKGMTRSPATCSLAHGALSAMGFAGSASPGKDYDFQTPDLKHPLEVSADFVGRFTDNPAATTLINYLSSTDAQRDWVQVPGSYAISADSQVPDGDYRNTVQRRIAAMLRPRSGYTLCFSAADAMRPDVSAAFYRAVLDYAADAQALSRLLDDLATVQEEQKNSPVSPDSLCAPA